MSYNVVDDWNNIVVRLDAKMDASVLAILCLAQAVNHLAYQVRELGNGDAATSMGAIENLAKELKEGLMSLTGALEGLNR